MTARLFSVSDDRHLAGVPETLSEQQRIESILRLTGRHVLENLVKRLDQICVKRDALKFFDFHN